MASKVSGLDRLAKKLARIPRSVKGEVAKALQVSADEISAMQRRLTPKDKGDLVDSIGNVVDADKLRAVMFAGGRATTRAVRKGADAEYDYALGQEFGTQNMPATPFFFPAYRALKKSARGRITRAMTSGVKKVAAGGGNGA